MSEEKPKFDARLKEGVEYFEQMLKVMPDDRTTLEFLAVAYPQLGETDKAEATLAELARVLLAEGDIESATALRPRLEACSSSAAQAMALKVRAAGTPKPELVPEPTPEALAHGIFAAAVASEAALADKLGEGELAQHIRELPDNGRVFLVSALSTLEKEKPEICEKMVARLADEYGDVPIPLDSFEPEAELVARLKGDLMHYRGVIPFAHLGQTALVAYLSPHDADLKRRVTDVLGMKCRFYLTDPRMVERALLKVFPEDTQKN